MLLLAIVVAGIWAYVSDQNEKRSLEKEKTEEAANKTESVDKVEKEIIANLSNIDANEMAESIKSQIALADKSALAADSKNQLSAVEIQLPGNLAQGSGNANYVYTSPNDRVFNWVMVISNASESFVRSKVYKSDYFGELTVINRNFWKLNYVQALQLAEKNGGLDFRNYYETSSVRLVLKNSDPKGWLYWLVTYTASGQNKMIQIDANSGAIIDIDSNDDPQSDFSDDLE